MFLFIYPVKKLAKLGLRAIIDGPLSPVPRKLCRSGSGILILLLPGHTVAHRARGISLLPNSPRLRSQGLRLESRRRIQPNQTPGDAPNPT
jgi:hypothetical protein